MRLAAMPGPFIQGFSKRGAGITEEHKDLSGDCQVKSIVKIVAVRHRLLFHDHSILTVQIM